MFNFDNTDMQRFAVSAVGALTLSAACVFGAVGPVKAATLDAPLTAASWQAKVERQIGSRASASPITAARNADDAVLAVRFTADGDYAGVVLARSSGDRALDAHAVRIARAIAYPTMPQAYRGQPQVVRMELSFRDDMPVRVTQLAALGGGAIQFAAR